MKKSIRLVLVSIICFFSLLCFAETSTIMINKQNVIVPNFEGFKLVADRNAPEFKKIEEQYSSDKNTITYGHYYEVNPGKISRFISILGYTESPEYLTIKQWSEAKNKIYEEYQKPTSLEQNNMKVEQMLIESITNKDLYNIYIVESKVYLKENNKSQYAFSTLDSKTYLYLNGKILVVMITIEGDNAHNVSTLQWAKTISEANAEKLIELNPPTPTELAAAKSAESKEQLDHIKYILLIILGLLALLWKYRFKYLPQSLHHYVATKKAEQTEIEKKPN